MADPYIAHIRNNETGEVRQWKGEQPWTPYYEWLWDRGSWGCDHCRSDFWHDAGSEPRGPMLGCDEGAFTVWIEQDGVIVYDEREEGNG